ncbi:MAG: DUF2935 domain-containing protein [Sedimentibacter sp.]|uniref:DUF2935 domain-containing protein n=1 Tax=Sedimentibacter sp. TaxID=1960295 RepID=UPI003158D7B2
MLNRTEYIRKSIETNLFFLRIMKEHMIFAAAALTFKDANMANSLLDMKNRFEQLLINTMSLSRGMMSPQLLAAGDIITPFTLNAEIATQYFTGIPINTDITRMEADMANVTYGNNINEQTVNAVNALNQQIIALLNATIQTQNAVLNNVLSCKMYTHLYPLMLDHVTREAEHYLEHLMALQKGEDMMDSPNEMAMHEMFWNNIMGEHAKFIRGMLDPTEEELIRLSNGYAMEFEELTNAAREAMNNLAALQGTTNRSITATTNLRNFKQQGTMGILECKIRSTILPLLSDHVLREANHYLKSLRMM